MHVCVGSTQSHFQPSTHRTVTQLPSGAGITHICLSSTLYGRQGHVLYVNKQSAFGEDVESPKVVCTSIVIDKKAKKACAVHRDDAVGAVIASVVGISRFPLREHAHVNLDNDFAAMDI